jgi:hypothetical protein
MDLKRASMFARRPDMAMMSLHSHINSRKTQMLAQCKHDRKRGTRKNANGKPTSSKMLLRVKQQNVPGLNLSIRQDVGMDLTESYTATGNSLLMIRMDANKHFDRHFRVYLDKLDRFVDLDIRYCVRVSWCKEWLGRATNCLNGRILVRQKDIPEKKMCVRL